MAGRCSEQDGRRGPDDLRTSFASPVPSPFIAIPGIERPAELSLIDEFDAAVQTSTAFRLEVSIRTRLKTDGGGCFRLILHHYDFSNYSEKVRIAMGYKSLDWDSVRIRGLAKTGSRRVDRRIPEGAGAADRGRYLL